MMSPDGIGVLLRRVREGEGRTREEQAQRVTSAGALCDVENIKRWETERRLPIPMWHPALAAANGLTVQEISNAVAASRAFRRSHGEEKDVKRRQFLGATAAVGGMAMLTGMAQARAGIDGALGGTGLADLEYLEGAFERHRGGYNGREPEGVLAQMHEDVLLLREVLGRPHPATERTELVRVAAGITGLVAIIQHDRGDQVEATYWFTTAGKAAEESGDARMAAWVAARHAMLPLNYGAPAQAAQIAGRALRQAGKHPTASAALAAAVAARSLAAVGDHSSARRAVGHAQRIADRLDGKETADTWFGYPEQKHWVHLSQAYTLLGDTGAAYQAQDSALALTKSPSVMSRALIAMDRAACLATDGDLGGAVQMAVGVLEQLPNSYRRGLVRSRAELLQQRVGGKPGALLAEALTT
ncbi:transcriptional regulator [Streptomyces sp. NPDC001389]|uniref:transcriptional regulator n=1 Tax=Streptomyces sp. NPDC001389 TaxID=3364569 RepID=UPI0036B1B2D7